MVSLLNLPAPLERIRSLLHRAILRLRGNFLVCAINGPSHGPIFPKFHYNHFIPDFNDVDNIGSHAIKSRSGSDLDLRSCIPIEQRLGTHPWQMARLPCTCSAVAKTAAKALHTVVSPRRRGHRSPFRHLPPARRGAAPRASPQAGCPGYRRACSRAAGGMAGSAAAQRPPSAAEPFLVPPTVPRH